jgi:hypothetical protein
MEPIRFGQVLHLVKDGKPVTSRTQAYAAVKKACRNGTIPEENYLLEKPRKFWLFKLPTHFFVLTDRARENFRNIRDSIFGSRLPEKEQLAMINLKVQAVTSDRDVEKLDIATL